MYSSLISFLKLNKIEYFKDFLGARLNYFEIGDNISLVIYPDTIKKLCILLKEIHKNKHKYYLLGNGTNVYISENYKGIIISTIKLQKTEVKEEFLDAYCGVSLSDVAFVAAYHGLTGLEFSFGIPGSVGGGVYMNASAYGGSVSNIVFKSLVYDTKEDEIYEIDKKAHGFDDKSSLFSKNKGIVALKTTFQLSYGEKGEILSRMKDNLLKRIKTQPLEYGNGGSTFKRPKSNYASKMIDECLLKGSFVNDAMISNHHAGFIINRKNATANDVTALIEKTKKSVYEKFKIELEKEIILVE